MTICGLDSHYCISHCSRLQEGKNCTIINIRQDPEFLPFLVLPCQILTEGIPSEGLDE